MIHRSSRNALKLDVAGLNEITVLIDRSETELTEVAINSWLKGLDGPPHAHNQKEQNFLVTEGHGDVIIAGKRYSAGPGDFFYLPAGVVHQTISRGPGVLAYFLFNAFLDSDKEGHASFADHIAKVKETRRQQAEAQQANVDPGIAIDASPPRPGKHVSTSGLNVPSTVILDRRETERCEAVHHFLPAGTSFSSHGSSHKEQSFFIVSGSGRFTLADESANAKGGEVVFAPRGAAYSVVADAGGLTMVSFGTIVEK